MVTLLLASLVMLRPQGAGFDGTNYYLWTGSTTSDGASFYVKAIVVGNGAYSDGTYGLGPKAFFMDYAGVATGPSPIGTTSALAGGGGGSTPPVPTPIGQGPASDSSSYQLTAYLCGRYTGAASGLPTSIAYSAGSLEQSSASSNQTGASASASTNRTSASATGNQSQTSSLVAATASGSLNGSAWQLNADGSYSFNSYLYTQGPNAHAYVPAAPPYASASAWAEVIFGVPTVTASH